MRIPVWCAELAAEFWADAGDPPPFPRDLRPVVAGALALTVVDLSGLRVAAVRDWFAEKEVILPLTEPDRPLRACLVAWRGHGFAFLDAGDDPAERRFSLAHELGHFLRDYWHPRKRAVTRLGPGVKDVLDGCRPPTVEERLHAVLRNVPLGAFAHLLRRDDSGRPLTIAEREAESAADRLAFELLAPAAAVGDADTWPELFNRLVGAFGLPPGPAARYAELLMPTPVATDPLFARLFAS